MRCILLAAALAVALPCLAQPLYPPFPVVVEKPDGGISAEEALAIGDELRAVSQVARDAAPHLDEQPLPAELAPDVAATPPPELPAGYAEDLARLIQDRAWSWVLAIVLMLLVWSDAWWGPRVAARLIAAGGQAMALGIRIQAALASTWAPRAQALALWAAGSLLVAWKAGVPIWTAILSAGAVAAKMVLSWELGGKFVLPEHPEPTPAPAQ
jgi:hypothetical protein